MPTVPEQLGALSILDTLKHASVPGTMTNLPWQTAVGSWSEATGWSPAAFVENAPTNTRSGLYINTGKVSGNYGLGLKKTTGSLVTVARQFEVWLFYQGAAAASGYQLRVITEASGSGKVQYKLTKWVEGVGTPLIESAKELTFAENDSFFVARVGNKLGIYHRTGEGTPELVGSEVEDTTFTEGYVGFGGNGSNPKLINLQGGLLEVGSAPEAVTEDASEVKLEKAKLNGLVDPNLATTKYYFQYCRLEPSFVLPESNTGLPIAVDATWIYFVNNQAGWIGRVKLDGTELNNKWVNIESAALRGLCVNATHIFWLDSNNNNIGRCKIDGTEVNKKFIEAIGESASSIQVNAANIFWTNTTGIGRATIAGAEKNNTWLAQGKNASICLNASNIFWTGFGKIGRATIAGGSVEESWVTGVEGGEGMACDAEAIYWGNPGSSAVGRVKINGTEVINKWVRLTKNGRSIAVVAAGVYVGGVSVGVPAIGRAKFLYIPESKEGSAGAGGEPAAVSQNVESLAKSTEYTFRVVATNANGESIGAWKSFITGGAGVVAVLVGGVVRNVRRWVLVKGVLVNK